MSDQDRDARYASHIPVLEAWLAGAACQVVEFGCGRFSTPELAKHATRLQCWEKSPQWLAEISALVPSAEIRLVEQPLSVFLSAFEPAIEKATAVFVDGAPASWRVEAMRAAARRKAWLVIAHDWGDFRTYGYDQLRGQLPGYAKAVYKCELTGVKTAVFRRGPTIEKRPARNHRCT
jgi:hypothetical protein